MIYLIVNESRTKCKIGYSKNPNNRLKSLQSGNPEKLEIIGVYKAEYADEAKYHRMFSHLKLTGEWFLFSPVIEDLPRRWANYDKKTNDNG